MPRTTRPLLAAVACALSVFCTLLPATASATPTRPPANLRLVLPLKADTSGLARFANEVSNPKSKLYRHYRSIAWLAEHFGASSAAKAKTVSYLRAHGATDVKVDRTGLFIDATLKTATAERLFRTALAVHANRAGAYVTQTSASEVPTALAGAVTGVVGLDTQPVVSDATLARVTGLASSSGTASSVAASSDSAFGSLTAPIVRSDEVSRSALAAAAPKDASGNGSSQYTPATGTQSGCAAAKAAGGFTPNQYLTAYNYQGLQASGVLGQGERVALIEIDGFKQADITKFSKCFGLPAASVVAFRTDDSVSKSGLAAGGEATLDIEVLHAAAPDLKQIDVYESSDEIASVLESLTSPLQNSGYKPEVISASLGLCESQVRAYVGLAGMRDTEAALQEAAASGISVLAASGDDGSADCVDSDSETALPEPQLAVNFPASSPYVTAVGGTNLFLNADNSIASQVVWNDASTDPGAAGGGGFSSVFTRPSYQSAVVATNSRALPDVSGLADVGPGYDVYCTAQPDCVSPGETDPWQPVGGTSASTPLLAGGLALIDQELRASKKQSLGLVNPLLYELGENAATAPQVFQDVTLGSDDVGPYIRASGAPLGCCSAGTGFDEASGWGSVNVGALAAAALTAQPAIVNVSQSIPANQQPLTAGAVYDTVSCSGACQIGALVTVKIGNGKPTKVYSGLYHLTAAGSKLVKVPFPKAELAKLRAAFIAGQQITATVVGAIVDSAGNVERQTSATALTITG